MTSPPGLVVGPWKFIYQTSNVCPFDCSTVTGSGKVGPFNHAGHTRKASRISKTVVDNCGKGVGNFYLS